MNSLEGFGIGSGDLDFGAARSVGVEVGDLVAELGHHGRAGRCGVVDEHRDVEIAGGKALGNVGEMHANFVTGHGVLGIFGGDVDHTTGIVKAEMVRSGFVGKAHGVVAAGGDGVVVGGERRLGG